MIDSDADLVEEERVFEELTKLKAVIKKSQRRTSNRIAKENEVFFKYLAKAKQGCGVSQIAVVDCYKYGFGVEEDVKRACHWAREASVNAEADREVRMQARRLLLELRAIVDSTPQKPLDVKERQKPEQKAESMDDNSAKTTSTLEAGFSAAPNVEQEFKHASDLRQLIDFFVSRRKSLGLSQRALAEKSGLTKTQVGRIECLSHLPEDETLKKYAKGFDVDLQIQHETKYTIC